MKNIVRYSVIFSVVALLLPGFSLAKGMFKPKETVDDSTPLSYSTVSYQPELSGNLEFNGRFALYQDARASRALCVQPSPASVLSRNGIGYSVGNPSSAEISALAKGIGQVERLLGRPLPPEWRTNYNFINASGKWNQSVYGINVRRPAGSDKGTSTGRLMHELGHKVGNAGVYQKYRTSTEGRVCAITPYASRGSSGTNRSNEEFAEVFEAYVVFPDLLKKKCPSSYAFFANELFPNSHEVVATCKGAEKTIMEANAEPTSGPRLRKQNKKTGAQ